MQLLKCDDFSFFCNFLFFKSLNLVDLECIVYDYDYDFPISSIRLVCFLISVNYIQKALRVWPQCDIFVNGVATSELTTMS